MIRGYLTSLGSQPGMGLFRRGNIIIKAQHNCVSDRRTYGGRFIPIVHEYVLLLRKETPLVIPFLMTYRVNSDIRDMPGRHMAGYHCRHTGRLQWPRTAGRDLPACGRT